MSLYENLAPVYDELFPLPAASIGYLEALVPARGEPAPSEGGGAASSPRRALDAGCATGSLVMELASRGWEALGIEPEGAMVELARARAKARGLPNARFALGDMLDAAELAGSLLPGAGSGGAAPRDACGPFDLVLCLGNTLPHLPPGKAARFLSVARGLLAPAGYLVLQLVNFSRPGIGPGYAFPAVEAGGYRLGRRYEPGPGGGLRFVVDLAEARSGQSRREELVLSPLTPGWLLGALREAGFGDPALNGGWDGERFDEGRHTYLLASAPRGPRPVC